jgi:serine/threonine-protein kinase
MAIVGAVVVACAIAGAFVLGQSKAKEKLAPPAADGKSVSTSSAVAPDEETGTEPEQEPAAPEPEPVAAEPAAPEPAAAEPPPSTTAPEPAAEKVEPAAPTKPEATEPEATKPEATAAPEQPRSSIRELGEVKKLIAARRREPAIDRLQALRKKYPKDAEVPFLLGNLYFEKQWWEHGFANYKAAIKNDPAYRGNATLVNHAIQNLMSPSQNWRGVRFLTRDIGKPAIPYLEKATKTGPGYIRKRARQVLDTLRRKKR